MNKKFKRMKYDLEFVQDVREQVRFFQEKPVIIVMELEP